MTDKLKPCPFCGSDYVAMSKGAHWVAPKYFGRIRVVGCGSCGVFGSVFNTLAMSEERAEQMAIESWNRRADNDR